jgi:hypothetical protein
MTLERLIELSGVRSFANNARMSAYIPEGSNISITGTEKAELQRKHNIQPGTPEWFQLWFSLPYLTGELPISK